MPRVSAKQQARRGGPDLSRTFPASGENAGHVSIGAMVEVFQLYGKRPAMGGRIYPMSAPRSVHHGNPVPDAFWHAFQAA